MESAFVQTSGDYSLIPARSSWVRTEHGASYEVSAVPAGFVGRVPTTHGRSDDGGRRASRCEVYGVAPNTNDRSHPEAACRVDRETLVGGGRRRQASPDAEPVKPARRVALRAPNGSRVVEPGPSPAHAGAAFGRAGGTTRVTGFRRFHVRLRLRRNPCRAPGFSAPSPHPATWTPGGDLRYASSLAGRRVSLLRSFRWPRRLPVM